MATEVLFPVGRMVCGSVYVGNDKDAEGKPLVIKYGPNAGQSRLNYYFAVAIPKSGEVHWNQTEWGQKIYGVAQGGWPGGQWQIPTFSWKITDGDSPVPNKKGIKPCDRTGWAKHWVVHLSSSFAPRLFNSDGSKVLVEPDAIKAGYYIQVFGSVASNESDNQPGVYLNHNYVALAGFGEEIRTGPDAAAVGFGGALPAGASMTPVATSMSVPADTNTTIPVSPPPAQSFAQPPMMTALAAGVPYETYIQSGWTDAQLKQNGLMV